MSKKGKAVLDTDSIIQSPPKQDHAHNGMTSGPVVVERVQLAADMDRRAALITVKLQDVSIHGISIWRSPGGRTRVHFPSYRLGSGWEDAIELPAELRAEVEEEVLAAYREEKKKSRKADLSSRPDAGEIDREHR